MIVVLLHVLCNSAVHCYSALLQCTTVVPCIQCCIMHTVVHTVELIAVPTCGLTLASYWSAELIFRIFM